MEDIVLQYTYPRIDAEVSKHRNHLLKAPFCIHPKTGRVCVPVDPERIEDFKPEEVPTVGQLLRELDEWNGDTEKHGMLTLALKIWTMAYESDVDWEKTSLKPYVDMLDKHALRIMEEVRISKRGATDMTW